MIALAADAAAKLSPYNLSDAARQRLKSNSTKMLISGIRWPSKARGTTEQL